MNNFFQKTDINMFSLLSTNVPKSTFIYKKSLNTSLLHENLDFSDGFHTLNLGYITDKYITNLTDTGSIIISIDIQQNTYNLISFPFSGIFCLCKSEKNKSGVVNTLCSTKNDDSEGRFIELKWNPYEMPCIILKWKSEKLYYKLLQFLERNNLDYSFKITTFN